MPLQKLQFRPGVNRESTTLANEGGWFECNKVRFRSGYPEKIGGWVLDTGGYYDNGVSVEPPSGSYWGVCRSMWNWETLQNRNLLALGTNLKYYIQDGPDGSFYDITPLRNPSGSSVGSAFSTNSGSTTVTVTDTAHGAQTGDFVTISGVSGSVNGIPNTALNKEFQITYLNSNQYTITTSAPATSTGGPTGSATFKYQITTGLPVFATASGWSAGSWGGTVSGAITTTLANPLLGTTLTSIVSTTDTTINVVSTVGFGGSGLMWINKELISYASTTGTSFLGCTRGVAGTTPRSYGPNIAVVANTTSVVLTSSASFGATGTILIGTELMLFSANNTGTNTLTISARGANGTTPSAHAAAATVTLVPTAGANAWNGWGVAVSSASVGQQLRLWSQSNYGEDLIFNPRGGAIYYWKTNANPNIFDRGTVFKAGELVPGSLVTYYDSTTPSVANIVMVSDSSRFVIAMGTNDPTGVYATTAQDPLQIRWSQQEAFYEWTPSATNQAGDYRLSRGSEIIAAQQTRQEILVFTDAAVYSMQYLGPPYVWGFQIMGDNISIAGPNVVTVANNVTYWMGTDKFYMYSGRVETLPCTLRQYVFDNINMQQSYQFFASTNEGYNEIWWFYCSITGPDGTGTESNPNTTVDRYIIFNHLERTWYYGTLDRTYWLDSPLREVPMAVTYDATNQSGKLVYHESGNDDGTTNPATPIEAYVQSSDFDIGDGHNFGLVWRIIPDVTFDGSNVNQPSVTFTVRPRQNPGTNYGSTDTPDVVSAQNYVGQQTYNVQQFTQYAYVRVRGRQMAFKISSDGLGVAWQLGTPRLDVRQDGRR